MRYGPILEGLLMVFKARWPLHHAACHYDSWQAILSRLFTELKDRRLGHHHIFILFFW